MRPVISAAGNNCQRHPQDEQFIGSLLPRCGSGCWDECLGAQPTVVSCPEDPAVRGRLTECLETILNKAQEPPKSKKVQHSNAKNAVLFEAISLIIHHDR